MDFRSMEFWKIVLDIIALLLCGVTILYLLRNRKHYRENFAKNPIQDETEHLSRFQDVLIESMDRAGKGFETVSEMLKKERSHLEKMGGGDRAQLTGKSTSGELDSDGVPSEKLYAIAREMVRKGIPADEISRITGIEKNEIELIAQIHGKKTS